MADENRTEPATPAEILEDLATLAQAGEARPGKTIHLPRANLPGLVQEWLQRLERCDDEKVRREAERHFKPEALAELSIDAIATKLGGLVVGLALGFVSKLEQEPGNEEPGIIVFLARRLGDQVRSKIATARNIGRRERDKRSKDKAARRKKRKETGR